MMMLMIIMMMIPFATASQGHVPATEKDYQRLKEREIPLMVTTL